MPQIHPTSTVDPRAELAHDVVVGPFCTIQGRVVIDAGTRLIHQVSVRGPMTIGKNNTIHPFVALGGAPQHRGFDPAIDGSGSLIGDGNVFRESFTLNRATGPVPTTVGHRNYFMSCSHVAHDCIIANDCNFANCTLVGGHAQIGDSVFLGGNAGVQQHVRVGRLAMVSAGMLIVRDLTPFCISYNSRTVGSLNIIGLRRAGLRQHIGPLNKAFNIIFRQRHAMRHAIELVERESAGDPIVAELIDFIRTSRRGITTCEIQDAQPAPILITDPTPGGAVPPGPDKPDD